MDIKIERVPIERLLEILSQEQLDSLPTKKGTAVFLIYNGKEGVVYYSILGHEKKQVIDTYETDYGD